jgi:hypothetical protein
MYEIADQHVILTNVRRGGATDDPFGTQLARTPG